MNPLLNLSFRYKVPLWGGVLIVVAALAVSAALMKQAYDDLKSDLMNSSANLSRTLAKTLFPSMMHEEVWRAYEIILAPLDAGQGGSRIQPELIVALDNRQRVFVSSQPKSVPLSADIRQFGEEYAHLADRIAARSEPDAAIIEFSGSRRIYVAAPIAEEGARLGTLVIVNSKDVFLPRFKNVASRGAVIGLLVLAVLLPINWYWGQSMTQPLSLLARHMETIHHQLPEALEPGIYECGDELGQLYKAFAEMVAQLKEKALLEKQMIQSERMAAVGRLTAGIAHEINNPIGYVHSNLVSLRDYSSGLLELIHAYERTLAPKLDAATLATLAEVRARIDFDFVSTDLPELISESREGLDRVRRIVQDLKDFSHAGREAGWRRVDLHKGLESTLNIVWNDLKYKARVERQLGALPLVECHPGEINQVFMNLLLNAGHAIGERGTITLQSGHDSERDEAWIGIADNGPGIAAEDLPRLFDPFFTTKPVGSGTGLGLSISYGIVKKHGGRIDAGNATGGGAVFTVVLPVHQPVRVGDGQRKSI